jgi:arylsulfatase A
MSSALLLTFALLSAMLLGGCNSTSDLSTNYRTHSSTLESPPNIIVILADDLGYGSLNSYGASRELIQTPNIDSLAENGVRFTDAYAPSSVCSPTRYGLLMGRYPWRTEKKAGVVHVNQPLWPSQERMSLSKWLKADGYATATIGKWHLGYGTKDHSEAIEEWINTMVPGPEALGFDYSFNVPQNHGDQTGVYFENGKIVGFDGENQLVGLRSTDKKNYGSTTYKWRDGSSKKFFGFDVPQRVDERVTDQITTRAIDWMEQQVEKDEQPFFLFFTPVAVHNPITPSVNTSGTSRAGPYGDFIHDLDNSIGRILDSLEQMGIADNTIIIFTSDNGGATPGNDTMQRLAIRSGLAINGLLRGGKASIWEGGTRVPLIVQIPNATHDPGLKISDTLVNLTDIFATLVDLVGNDTALPYWVAPDSISFLPVILSDDTQAKPLRTSTVTANHAGVLAIRSGDWKWVERLPDGFDKMRGIAAPGGDQTLPQLYNLRESIEEKTDVSSDYPQIVEQLRQELEAIRESKASDGPSAPHLTGIKPGNGQVSIHISLADRSGPPINRYAAVCRGDDGLFFGASAASPIIVSGLTNGVTYRCAVTATNDVGTSPFLSAVSAPFSPIADSRHLAP